MKKDRTPEIAFYSFILIVVLMIVGMGVWEHKTNSKPDIKQADRIVVTKQKPKTTLRVFFNGEEYLPMGKETPPQRKY